MKEESFLILGINGMTGHLIGQYLVEQGYKVKGFAKINSSICQTFIGDAYRQEDIIRVLQEDTFDYIINCIGILNKSVDLDLAKGIYLNSVLPHFLSQQVKKIGAKLIHISTDCVFEGTRGQYLESDYTDAKTYYGRSKALGEVIDDNNLTIRTSVVGPELKRNGIGLFHWFMLQHKEVEGYENVLWSGITTLQLAKVIEENIRNPHTGLYHLVNNMFISKYDLLNLFNKYCRESPIIIKKNDKVISNKTLINTQKHKFFYVPTYEEMIVDLKNWIEDHPKLYMQYRGL